MKKTEEAFGHFVQVQVSTSNYLDFGLHLPILRWGGLEDRTSYRKKTFSIVFDFLNSASVMKS